MLYALTMLILAAAAAACALLWRQAAKRLDDQGRKRLPRTACLGAAAGFALFFLLESGIARYIGQDLLACVREGQPLPWRALRMGVCVTVCFAAAVTEQGEKLRRAVRNACSRDWGRWLVSAVVVGLFFLWGVRVTVLSYMTSDEAGILNCVRRIPAKGLSAAANTYSHVLFCWLISLFYRIDPDVSWYALYQLFAIAVSLTVIGRCILKKTLGRGWPLWAGVCIHAALCAGAFLYSLALIAYTVTAAIVGSAAVALVLCREDAPSRGAAWAEDIGSVALMLLCVGERWESGLSVLCFWALAVAYRLVRYLLRRDSQGRRRARSLCAMALATAVLVAGGRVLAHSSLVGYKQGFNNADAARTLIVDYLVDELTEEDYAAVGIPPELGTLIHGWYFMDERVTTDTFQALADAYYANHEGEALGQVESARSFGNYLTELADAVHGDSQQFWRSLCLGALFLALCGAFLSMGRAYWPEWLCGLAALGGTGVLLLYLVIQGRFMTRAFLVAALPATVTLLLMALSAPAKGTERPVRQSAATLLAGLGVLGALCCCAMTVWDVPYVQQAADSDDLFGWERAIDGYMYAHPDITCITNIYTTNLDPFRAAEYPDNKKLWGNRGDISSSPEHRLFSDAFFRDDVQLVTDNPFSAVLLMQFLSLDYGPVEARVVDRPGGAYVFDISQVLPDEPDYTGWYEQNGKTYYFQDGQALSGEQTVDGEPCSFTPPGAGSRFFAVDREDGQVYSTFSYCLAAQEG